MEKNTPKVVIIVQARMGSTRLPKKVLMPVLEKPLLTYLIERLRRVKNADAIVVATTNTFSDQQIVDLCQKMNIDFFRGDEENVLKRYYQAALFSKADVIVRITGDCPLIDPETVEKVIQYYLDNNFDYVGNTLKLTYPRGMDTEVFSFKTLQKAFQNAIEAYDKEHVTAYIYRNPKTFSLANVPSTQNNSHYRLTVDTPEDFQLIKILIESLYPLNPYFKLDEIIKFLENNPTLAKINSHVIQKSINEG